MKDALKTLFLPVRDGSISLEDKKILFLNAMHDPLLENGDWDCRQVFKPYADELKTSKPDYDCPPESYDLAFIPVLKDNADTYFLIATALHALKKDGVLVCAGDNKAGGKRLKEFLDSLGLENLNSESKHKCRVVWGKAGSYKQDLTFKWIENSKPQKVLDGKFISQRGIFGWNKYDIGSRIFCDVLPDDLKGYGADLGCGFGFLAVHALAHCPKIKHIECHDADIRAIKCCEANIKDKASHYWTDLSKPFKPKRLLDFVIMNPPYHWGKRTDTSLGKAFIENAAKALRRKGVLWMVANAHLPYEETLNAEFFKVEKIAERQGFKIYRAEK